MAAYGYVPGILALCCHFLDAFPSLLSIDADVRRKGSLGGMVKGLFGMGGKPKGEGKEEL